jgi:hypothetical protein
VEDHLRMSNGSRTQGKYWCFTLNNYTDAEEKAIEEYVAEEEPLVNYIIYGREVGDNGTPHLQGYLELRRKRRLSSVKKLPGLLRAHLERRRGTATEAATYCRKDGNVVEYGAMAESNQGKRTDLDSIREKIANGSTDVEIANEHFGDWVRYRKSFNAYRQLTNKKVARDIQVTVLVGAPGVGKTRLVFEKEGDDLFICPDEKLKWFDGYNGEAAILIDDYRGEGEPSYFLRLLDRYPVQLPVKGSYVPLQATRIYITSNQNPPWGHPNPEAVKRRIHSVLKIAKKLIWDSTVEEEQQMLDLYRGMLPQ